MTSCVCVYVGACEAVLAHDCEYECPCIPGGRGPCFQSVAQKLNVSLLREHDGIEVKPIPVS